MGMWKAIKDKYSHGASESRISKVPSNETVLSRMATSPLATSPRTQDHAQLDYEAPKISPTDIMYLLNTSKRQNITSASRQVVEVDPSLSFNPAEGSSNRRAETRESDFSTGGLDLMAKKSSKGRNSQHVRGFVNASTEIVTSTPRRGDSQRDEQDEVPQQIQFYPEDGVGKPPESTPPYMRFKSAPEDIKEQRLTDHILRQPYRNLDEFYTLGKELGSGISAVVRTCAEKSSGQKFACKSIDKAKVLSVKDLEALRTEVETMAEVGDHAGVIGLHEVFEDTQNIHLVLDLCEGGELYHRIISKKMYSERDAAKLSRKLVSAIKYCHSRRIMHRDLKPENILLTSRTNDTNIQLADFGHATRFYPGKKLTQVVGTAYYIAPEVLNCSYGPEADMWSLGVILYILLSGVPPFRGDSRGEIFRVVRTTEVSFDSSHWGHVSEGARDLIRKLLTKDPERRLTAAQMMEHPWILEHYAAGVPVALPVAERMSMAPRLASRGGRQPVSYEHIPVAGHVPTVSPVVSSDFPVALPVSAPQQPRPEPLVQGRGGPGSGSIREGSSEKRQLRRGVHRRAPSRSSEDLFIAAANSVLLPPAPGSEASFPGGRHLNPASGYSEKRGIMKSASVSDRPQSSEFGAGKRSSVPLSPNSKASPPFPMPRNRRPIYYTDSYCTGDRGSGSASSSRVIVSQAVPLSESATEEARRRHRSCGDSFWGSFDTDSITFSTPEREEQGTGSGRMHRTSSSRRQGEHVLLHSPLSQSPLPKCVLADVPPALLVALHQKPVRPDQLSP